MVRINLSREDWSRVGGASFQQRSQGWGPSDDADILESYCYSVCWALTVGGTESSTGKEVSTAVATCKTGRKTCACLKVKVEKQKSQIYSVNI